LFLESRPNRCNFSSISSTLAKLSIIDWHMIRVTNPFHNTAVSISRQTSEYNGDNTASRKRGRRTHSTLPINQNCASNVNLNFISVVLNGKKITLVIQLSSFIQKVVDERGVRILAITLAFQAREAGSIPARRSIFHLQRT
jgi:hypothetical protein